MSTNKTFCFVSNYLTPHQLPFCLELQKATQGNFTFIETENLPEERTNLGYPNLSEQYDFVISANKDTASYEKALKTANESDVVIIGSAPDIFIKKRLKSNKLTFRFSERIFKKRSFDPLRLIKHTLKNRKYRRKNLFYLLSSAYAPHDYIRCGAKKEKLLKWGYFPPVSNDYNTPIEKTPNKAVWVGRLIDWKHPEHAINAVIELNKKGYNVELDLVGSGEEQSKLTELINLNGAKKYIKLLGNQPYDQVRSFMKNAEIFLFTSDYNEGWGAVLNEAMDSGCVVIASHAAGSVPFLIKNQENGFIYNHENPSLLVDCLEKILKGEVDAKKISTNARKTISNEWNAIVETEKFVEFCNAFFDGDYKTAINKDGVLSPCEPIAQNKMYELTLNRN